MAIVSAFAEALGRFGWVEGKNIRIDYRFAAGDAALFETYAAELVGPVAGRNSRRHTASGHGAAAADAHDTDRLCTTWSIPSGWALFKASRVLAATSPGSVPSTRRSIGKWLQLLKEIAPAVTRVAVIFNPDTAPFAPLFNRVIEAAAPSFGMTVTLAPVHDDAAIEEAVAAQAREPGGGLIILPDPFTVAHRDVIIAAASRHRLPDRPAHFSQSRRTDVL